MARKKVGEKVAAVKASSEIALVEVLRAVIAASKDESTDEQVNAFYAIFSKFLKQEVAKFPIASEYNILCFLDNTTMVKGDADRVYKSVGSFGNEKPLLVILLSYGGAPGPAYLIGKLLREHSNGKLVIAVPRHAKSAATLVSCAADQIHMGSLSELGPIDPQIEGMPVLGLKNSIEHIAELVDKHSSAAEMFARYLARTVEPIKIGYNERVARSAAQYAERLLKGHRKDLPNPPADIAEKLVYEYEDHGFVIDKTEAVSIFGEKMIKSNTSEYDLADAIYSYFTRVEDMADTFGRRFYFIGSMESLPFLYKKDGRG